MSLLARASARHFVRHPWQLGLSILGVALGVAVVLSIDLASGSALAAFRLSTDSVTGRASHQVVGGSLGVPEDLYRELRVERGIRPSAPVVDGYVYFDARPDRAFRLLGVDPFAEQEFRSYVGDRIGGPDRLTELMTVPGAVLMPADAAAALGAVPGDRLALEADGRPQEAVLAGYLEIGDQAAGDLLLADVATAQEFLGFTGRLSRIDLLAPEDDGRAAFLERAAAALPGGVELVAASSSGDTAEQMTAAFRINLQALSLLALLCGAFLIYNTITFAVVQRRSLLGTLRSLGVTGREVFRLILLEALAIGLVGSLIGIWAGALLGGALIRQVTQTINDLYFVLTVTEVGLPVATLVKGAVLGIGASLIAALAPAIEAMAASPRSSLDRAELESRVHRALPRVTAAGILSVAAGGGLLLVPGSLFASFAGLFAVLLGFALATPAVTVGLMAVLTPLAGLAFGQIGRMAGRGTVAALSRTGVAVAALMMAVSVAVGVDLMIRSFRGTVESWLEYSLPADLYLATTSTPGRRFSSLSQGFEPESVERIRAVEGVEVVNTVRQAEIPTVDGPLRLMSYDLDPMGRGAIAFTDGAKPDRWQAVDRGEAVFVSEPLAYRRGLETGSEIELPTPTGSLTLPIAGVYYDYASERGAVLLDHRLYSKTWSDERITALSLYARAGTDLDGLADRVRAAVGGDRLFQVRSNQAIRGQSLQVFDRTFLVTGVLRVLALIVAFVGVLSALTALQLERARELGVLRAYGLTPGQVWGIVTSQTGLLGLAAGLISIPVGLTMASIMVYVINRRSFGWTLELQVAPESLLAAVGLALGAALIAGVYPAFRMASTSPAEALRGE